MRRSLAFSLVELVLVVAILAVLTAIAIPRYGQSAARFRADAAARRVAVSLDLARSEARRQSDSVTVHFELPPNNRLWIPGVMSMNKLLGDHIVTFAEEPYGATLVAADFGGSPSLSFDGFGQPSTGGTVQVRVGETLKTVVLDPDTGKATVQ